MKTIYLLILFLSVFAGKAMAFGVKASPGAFIIHNVNPGSIYDVYGETGLRITLYNDSSVEYIYALSVEQPTGPLRGYQPIPDTKWIEFEPDIVDVSAGKQDYGYMIINIPDEERYYNQSWVVNVIVTNYTGGSLAVAIKIRVQIETKSKGGNDPNGIIAVSPNVMSYTNYRDRKPRLVRIYNNDIVSHTYRVSVPVDKEIWKYQTHGYNQLLTATWLKYDQEAFIIKAGESVDYPIQLMIPDRIKYKKRKWEEVLIVETEDGQSSLIRVRF